MQLSQSCLGLKQFSKAEEYLSLARWIVLNTPTCSDKIKTRLHMLKGRVAISQGKHTTAETSGIKLVKMTRMLFINYYFTLY